MLTVPNLISMTRILLIPVFMLCMNFDRPLAALLLFIGISLTDYLDGYLARKLNQVTDLGKVLDPLADKLLVTAAIVQFAADGKMAAWMAVVIIAREMVISTLRAVAASKGLVLAAGWPGKIKTFLQMGGIMFILSPWHGAFIPGTEIAWSGPVVWLITLVTLWSGGDYLWKYRGMLK